MQEADAILANIGKQPGVLGTLVMTTNGITIKSTFSAAEAANYAAIVSDFIKRTQNCADSLMPGQPLQVLRVRSFKNELIIIPEKMFTLVVVQDSGAA